MTESTFKSRLNSILKDNATERWVGNKLKGKINTKRLHKIIDSGKVFKRKEERKGKDYSITFLLDASGSMRNDQSAVASAMAHIGKALNKTDIPFSVYAFSQNVRLIKSFGEKYEDRRVRSLYYEMFSSPFYLCYGCHQYDIPIPYDGRKQNPMCPFCKHTQLNVASNGGTNDAYALHVVGNTIHKAYKKNILIVITDGEGNNLENDSSMVGNVKFSDLKNNRTVINKLHSAYEDLITLGISVRGSYTDRVYGKRFSKNIRKPEQIFDAVAKLLATHIKRG